MFRSAFISGWGIAGSFLGLLFLYFFGPTVWIPALCMFVIGGMFVFTAWYRYDMVYRFASHRPVVQEKWFYSALLTVIAGTIALALCIPMRFTEGFNLWMSMFFYAWSAFAHWKMIKLVQKNRHTQHEKWR